MNKLPSGWVKITGVSLEAKGTFNVTTNFFFLYISIGV